MTDSKGLILNKTHPNSGNKMTDDNNVQRWPNSWVFMT